MKSIIFTTLCVLFTFFYVNVNGQAFTFSTGSLEYLENFDGMASTSNYLQGWSGVRASGTGAVGEALNLLVSDGSNNAGGVYNVGTTSESDRAMGSLGSNSTVPAFGAFLRNETGASITKLVLSGISEQWRAGTNATANERSFFEYSLDATSLTTGTWTKVSEFDLVELATTTTTAAALNGNAPENRTEINATIDGLAWATGSTIWIRWTDDNAVGSDGLLAIDDLKIVATTGSATVLPEPTNYPTNFTVSAKGFDLKATWTDAVGAQTPSGYLLLISTQNNILPPEDGTYTADDLDFSDGKGAKNISYGVEEYVFSGLNSQTLYHVTIYPYTNGGSLVDYKTNGTPPSVSKETQKIIKFDDFEGGFNGWTEFSVAGDQKWEIDPTHGIDGSACLKMTGYAGGASNTNEDWLISPPISVKDQGIVHARFFSAKNYAGDNIKVKVSENYNSGNPTAAVWEDITAEYSYSSGSWAWVNSGFAPINSASTPQDANVHIAFVYTSNDTQSSTWEIDEVTFTGDKGPLSVKENIFRNLKIYPNPVSEILVLENNELKALELQLVNIQGQIISVNKIEKGTNEINVKNFAPGTYLLRILDAKTGKFSTEKIIIK